jgi:phosphoribosylanthranilate isomerase
MTWVKICGITNLEDAKVAVDAGADALGFVFYEKSPRRVRPQLVREIVSQLPANIEKVGVFAGDSVGSRSRIAHQARLTAVQLPGLGRRELKDLSIGREKVFVALSADRILNSRMGGFKWRAEAKGNVSAFLLDAVTDKKPGGTGHSFDWSRVATVLHALGGDYKFVVAGGLNPANVAEAMRILKPWGVDVSSGVEARPGKKDPEKVRAFVNAVREADRNA